MSVSNKLYPVINRNEKSLFQEITESDVDKTVDESGVTSAELNSAIYKSDFKSFRDTISKDISKYHSLEVKYGRFISYLTGLIWLLGFTSFILSGIDAIMSSMIANGTSLSPSQSQFNQAMLETNWLDIIFLVLAALIGYLQNRESGNLAKHTAHKTKAREYINILTTNFSTAYTDKIITSDEMKAMTDLQTNYESEQIQISLSGKYYTTSGSTSSGAVTSGYTSVPVQIEPLTPALVLNDQQQTFLNLMKSLQSNSPAVV